MHVIGRSCVHQVAVSAAVRGASVPARRWVCCSCADAAAGWPSLDHVAEPASLPSTDVRALVERQARAWERADAEAIVADFAPDGVLTSPSGSWRGREEIRTAAEDVFEMVSGIEVDITRVLAAGSEGAVEWTWAETSRADGKRRVMEDGIVFELRDGKIIRWREYFDPDGKLLDDPDRD